MLPGLHGDDHLTQLVDALRLIRLLCGNLLLFGFFLDVLEFRDLERIGSCCGLSLQEIIVSDLPDLIHKLVRGCASCLRLGGIGGRWWSKEVGEGMKVANDTTKWA